MFLLHYKPKRVFQFSTTPPPKVPKAHKVRLYFTMQLESIYKPVLVN